RRPVGANLRGEQLQKIIPPPRIDMHRQRPDTVCDLIPIIHCKSSVTSPSELAHSHEICLDQPSIATRSDAAVLHSALSQIRVVHPVRRAWYVLAQAMPSSAGRRASERRRRTARLARLAILLAAARTVVTREPHQAIRPFGECFKRPYK